MRMHLDGITSINITKPKQVLDCSKCCELGTGEKQCTQDQCYEWEAGEIVLMQQGDFDTNVITIGITPSCREADLPITIEEAEEV